MVPSARPVIPQPGTLSWLSGNINYCGCLPGESVMPPRRRLLSNSLPDPLLQRRSVNRSNFKLVIGG